ncbi:MAG: LysM peptidoglycan-binding domain-containing protein [Butyrivibrio sp.]|nr:LysM peptidoglycan-binding domain-containing protein [Butyrivibrio sp.]
MSEAMRAAASLYNDPRYYSRSEIRIRRNKLRRQRIVRRQIVLLSLAVALIIFMIIFLASSFMSDAKSDSYEPLFKYYKTVTVHAGDSLWNIARDNYTAARYSSIDEYMSEICSINAISDIDRLNAGEAVIIPYYSAEFK